MLQPLPKKISSPAVNRWIILLILAAFFVLPKIAAAEIMINEISWMGSLVSTNDEWIELYNNDSTSVDLTGWKIIWGADNKYTINLTGQISANNYFLLERTDENSVPNITADQIYKGTYSLNNLGDHIKLYDAQNNLINDINATDDGWPAGDNVQKLTMERTINNTWQNSTNPNGTPRSINSSGENIFTPSPSATLTPTPSPSPSPLPSSSPRPDSSPSPGQSAEAIPSATPETSSAPAFQYSSDILLSEFFPYPESGSPEWVEIYNAGDATINLTGWSLADAAGHNFAVADQAQIAASQYLVVSLNQSLLNNDGDQIKLLWPDGQTIHSVAYQKAKQNYACARFNGQWLWTNQPTPGSANKKYFSAQSSSSLTPSPSPAVSIPATPGPSAVLKEETAADFSSSQSTAKKETTANEKPTASQPSLGLTASAQEPIKNSSFKSALTLIAVVLFAGLTAGGLIYFKKQKQIDIKNQDT